MQSLALLDVQLFHLINHQWISPVLDALFVFATWVGKRSWLFIVAVPFLWVRGGKRERWYALLAIAAIAFSDSLPTHVLKSYFARPRPFNTMIDVRLLVPVEHISLYSFPSNHAANMFALATLTFFLYPKRRFSWALAALAVLISYSRVYVGVHYPSDVLGGAGLGAFIGGCMFLVWKKFGDKTESQT